MQFNHDGKGVEEMFHHNIQDVNIPGKAIYIHTIKRKDVEEEQVSYQIEWDLEFDENEMC